MPLRRRGGTLAQEAPLTESGEACAYTDGSSTGSRGPGGYGAVLNWQGNTEGISGGELDTTNLRMELTATCAALETIDEGPRVTGYSDSSYLVNCMRRGWHEKWRENGWLNHRSGGEGGAPFRLAAAVLDLDDGTVRVEVFHAGGGVQVRPNLVVLTYVDGTLHGRIVDGEPVMFDGARRRVEA